MKYAFKRERYQKVTCTQLHEPNYDLSQYSVWIITILIYSTSLTILVLLLLNISLRGPQLKIGPIPVQ